MRHRRAKAEIPPEASSIMVLGPGAKALTKAKITTAQNRPKAHVSTLMRFCRPVERCAEVMQNQKSWADRGKPPQFPVIALLPGLIGHRSKFIGIKAMRVQHDTHEMCQLV